MKVDKKKMFGIVAVVLMLLVAIAPAVNSMQLSSEEMNELENDPELSNTGSFDLEITVDKLEFDKYVMTKRAGDYVSAYAYYTLRYTLTNTGTYPYVGRIITEVRKEPEPEYGVFDEGIHTIEGSGGQKSFTHTIKIWASDVGSEDKERFFAGKEIVVETVTVDGNGVEDPTPENNTFTKVSHYWNQKSSYIASKAHIALTLPNEEWVDKWEKYVVNGTTITIPRFKELYTKFALPSLFGSNRMGWLWDLAHNLSNFTTAFLDFVYEFCQVLADIVAVLIELQLLVAEIIAFFTPIIDDLIFPTGLQVVTFIGTVSALALTLKKLLIDIDDLPIDPDDPEDERRQRVEAAARELRILIASKPWYDDITIKGDICKVKDDEIMTVKCRDETWSVEENGDPTSFGPFSVPSDWDLLEDRFKFLFRNCRITVTGDDPEHTGQKLKTPGFLSWIAPRGTLGATFGFRKKSRDLYRGGFLQRLLEMFPVLKQLLPSYFFQPAYE